MTKTVKKTQAVKRPAVIIIDNNNVLDVLEKNITCLEYDCAFVSLSAQKGDLQKLADHSIALIIVDIENGLSGINRLIRSGIIRNEREKQSVPVIVLHESDNERDLKKVFSILCKVDMFSKPFPVNILINKVALYLKFYMLKQENIHLNNKIRSMDTDFFEFKKKLRKKEKKFRNIIHLAQEGIIIINIEEEITYVNPYLANMLGYKPNEMIGMSVFHFMNKEDRQYALNEIRGHRYGKQTKLEFPFKKKSGEKVYGLVNGSPIYDECGSYSGAMAIVSDISERKRIEHDLKNTLLRLENFNRHQLRSIELERSSIARLIHDSVGQTMTIMENELKNMLPKIKDDDDCVERIEKILALAEETIVQVRQISGELRPGILDDLGLVSAIRWYVNEQQARTNLKFHLNLDDITLQSSDQELVLFRVLQEAVTNVVRHSEATKVKVELKLKEEELSLKVHDNGKGIPDNELYSSNSFGLIGMMERIKFVDGIINIENNRGTEVFVSMPYKNKDASS